MATIRVITAVVDTKQLTLYREDGTTYDIPQGEERLALILNEISPILEAGLVATVDLHEPTVEEDRTFQDFEEHTGGLTRFFRVAKSKVKHLLGLDDNVARAESMPVAPRAIGKGYTDAPVPAPVAAPEQSSKLTAAISDIMAHAEPVSSPKYKEEDTTKEDTFIAVTQNKEGKPTIVPGVENLKGHIAHATKLKDAVGMTAFLQRLGAAIESRDHSVSDVLQFMERGDLPLADDGSIIAYKVLQTKGSDADTFVDCHTGKVTQKVGSFVCMDIKMVDRSRGTECSYGLHIARRGYLRSFSGNIMVLCKIAPEDVIAVPHRDPNKVRVRAYHIISRVPADEHQNLRAGKPFQTPEGQRLLTMAIKGDHAPAWQKVEILDHTSNGAKGDVRITNLLEAPVAEIAVKAEVVATPSIPDRVDPDAPIPRNAPVIDPKALAKEVDARRSNTPLSKSDQARVLFKAGKFAELLTFKKDAKKSWITLGFNAEEIAKITGKADSVETLKDLASLTQPKPVLGMRPEHVSNVKTVAKTVEASKNVIAPEPNKEVKMSGTRAEVARKLFDEAVAGDKSRWASLWLHQKQAKKSWAILGFNTKEIERIKTNKPDHV